MQSLPVYLYSNLFEVLLDLDNNGRVHQIMYQRPLVIQKGVTNTVRIQFKNSDQKRIDVSEKAFLLNVFDAKTGDVILTKEVTIVDDGTTTLKGLGEISFIPSDIVDALPQAYNFSIVELTADGSRVPAYTNTYYGVAGTLEIKEEVYPNLVPSIEVASFHRNYNSNQNKLQWEYDTGNIEIYPDQLMKGALHTAAFYMTNFKGTVYVEGTLENSPGTYGKYATLASVEYNGFNGIDYVNFNGVFTNLRVTYIPKKNPVNDRNDDTAYSGTFDKVLLRS